MHGAIDRSESGAADAGRLADGVEPRCCDDDLSARAIEGLDSGIRLVGCPLAPCPGGGNVLGEERAGALLGVAEELAVHGGMSHGSGDVRWPVR